MSNWLQYKNQANKLKQTYLTGFFDVSGGDIINRTGDLYVFGNSYLNTNMRVGGQSFFYNNVYISGDISMNGNILLPSGDLQTMLSRLFSYTDQLIIENTQLQSHILTIDTSFNQLYGNYQSLNSQFLQVQSKVGLVSNIISDFMHISHSGTYDLSSNMKYIIENDCSLNLPTNVLEGTTVVIANNSSNLISIHSIEKMYNTFYLPKGGNQLYIATNGSAYATYVKNNTSNVNSWNVLMS